jgi:inhibitor of KinA sporulation pathway (predicted exonuclease)
LSSFNLFIKLVRHPKSTPFCTQLTSITQADVDNAKSLKEVMRALMQWLHPYNGSYVMCSWGNYDRNHIISDCDYFDVNNPIVDNHLNLKAAFAKKQKIKPCGLQRALTCVNLDFKGQHHCGIDDAHNIVRLLDYCI